MDTSSGSATDLKCSHTSQKRMFSWLYSLRRNSCAKHETRRDESGCDGMRLHWRTTCAGGAASDKLRSGAASAE